MAVTPAPAARARPIRPRPPGTVRSRRALVLATIHCLVREARRALGQVAHRPPSPEALVRLSVRPARAPLVALAAVTAAAVHRQPTRIIAFTAIPLKQPTPR